MYVPPGRTFTVMELGARKSLFGTAESVSTCRTRRDAVVGAAAPRDVRNGCPVNFQAGSSVPSEIGPSDHNETATWLSSGVGYRDCREEDKNQKKSAAV